MLDRAVVEEFLDCQFEEMELKILLSCWREHEILYSICLPSYLLGWH